MVQEKIDDKFIEDVCKAMKFYDKYKKLPFEKVRIDITISREAVAKIKEEHNKSEFIDNLIISA